MISLFLWLSETLSTHLDLISETSEFHFRPSRAYITGIIRLYLRTASSGSEKETRTPPCLLPSLSGKEKFPSPVRFRSARYGTCGSRRHASGISLTVTEGGGHTCCEKYMWISTFQDHVSMLRFSTGNERKREFFNVSE